MSAGRGISEVAPEVAPDRGFARGARARVARAWADGGTRERIALVLGGALAAALGGAFVFGVIHIGVGGVVKGNWRAGGFGIALAAATGLLVVLEALAADRLLPGRTDRR